MQCIVTVLKTTAIQTKSQVAMQTCNGNMLPIMPEMFKAQVQRQTKQRTTRATLVGTSIQSCTHKSKHGSVFEMEGTSKQN